MTASQPVPWTVSLRPESTENLCWATGNPVQHGIMPDLSSGNFPSLILWIKTGLWNLLSNRQISLITSLSYLVAANVNGVDWHDIFGDLASDQECVYNRRKMRKDRQVFLVCILMPVSSAGCYLISIEQTMWSLEGQNIIIDGLVPDCINSSANALELMQSHTKPSILSPQCVFLPD